MERRSNPEGLTILGIERRGTLGSSLSRGAKSQNLEKPTIVKGELEIQL
jgi:hypothetical protein